MILFIQSSMIIVCHYKLLHTMQISGVRKRGMGVRAILILLVL